MNKKGTQAVWILVGSIVALISLVVVIAIFTTRVGEGSKKLKNVGNSEIGALTGESCKSVVLERICVEECPEGYREVTNPGGWKDCDKVCCEKVIS